MVIKGTVGSPQSEPEKAKMQKSEGAGEKTLGKLSYALRRQIVQECVQEVMDKINLSRGR